MFFLSQHLLEIMTQVIIVILTHIQIQQLIQAQVLEIMIGSGKVQMVVEKDLILTLLVLTY